MLDSDTKRRIDTARDILVGKVPDPKSQVDQITIALIYKFMDDIDAQSEEWGGDRTFFAGEFSRYGWAKLMSPGLGGHERLNLYAESISRMGENPGVPPLFRAIFDNAFLPYRDPETLTAFLKIIDQFNYDHSERLGDSFEYLLQVMGAQGDAGQFRTPRHIIDFIVRIVDPQKHETILDPACGTAGFLISAYKHIRAANIDEHGILTLTPDDIKRLFANITGYDISPDMVRLSLANMYLHGFPDPHVYEYDTLTSEERWNERADVILANPPFMSPKGGIRPHNRFGVQSKRSEVLFVDYIAEHLTPGGRAGVIVPEGVIFQSQRAYTQLRKMLIEEYLAAVVSLPAGVFNPYSGVKTSILLLDTAIARKTDRIAFFKVENDGFDLGAQRRPIDANDLPSVEAELAAYLRAARAGEPMDDTHLEHCMIVDKQRIAADGEHNLSAERYRDGERNKTKYEWVKLGDIILSDPQYGSVARKVPYDGKVRYVRITDLTNQGDLKPENPVSPSVIQPEHFLEPGDLLIARSGSVGRTYLHGSLPGTYQYAGYLIRFRIDPSKALPEYVFHISQSDSWREQIASNSKTGTLTNINAKQYASFRFPLPPLAVQREIVEEVEGYQRVIDGARAVVESWRPRVWVEPGWEVVRVGEVSDVIPGQSPPGKSYNTIGEGEPFYQGKARFGEMYIGNPNKWTTDPQRFANEGDIVMSVRAPVGPVNLTSSRICIGRGLAAIRPKKDLVMTKFLFYTLYSLEGSITGNTGATFASISKDGIEKIKIPLPQLHVQERIVSGIENEQEWVSGNMRLIERMSDRIWSVLARVLP